MSDKHYSFFGAVEKSFDKAAEFTKWESGYPGTNKNMQCCLSNEISRLKEMTAALK